MAYPKILTEQQLAKQLLEQFNEKHNSKPTNQHPVPIQQWIKRMQKLSIDNRDAHS